MGELEPVCWKGNDRGGAATAAVVDQRNIFRRAAADSVREPSIVAVVNVDRCGRENGDIEGGRWVGSKQSRARVVGRVDRAELDCAGRAHLGYCRECR